MAGFGSTKSERPPVKEAGDEPKKQEVEIVFEDLDSNKGGGYTIGLAGKWGTGKTVSAMCLGYLQKKFIPELREAGFKAIPEALEKDEIPEIKKIFVVESERGLQKQKDRAAEKALIIPEITKMTKIFKIAPVTKDEIASVEKGVAVTPESMDKIFLASDMYTAAIEHIDKVADQNTLFILDSASRYKLLLDTKSIIISNIKMKSGGEEAIKAAGFGKWEPRNAQWLRSMTLIRGIPGWVVCTFMDDENSDAVMAMQKNAGKGVKEFKREWAPKTQFNFDMVFNFTQENPDAPRFVHVDFARYMYHGEDKTKYDGFELKGKFGFLWAIEGMLLGIQEVVDSA